MIPKLGMKLQNSTLPVTTGKQAENGDTTNMNASTLLDLLIYWEGRGPK